MPPITTSVFELFKIGPGPSSSHTIGPMRAGADFRKALSGLPEAVLARAEALEVRLFGSLSATGRGHGTDRALLAGLLGMTPDACTGEDLDELARDPERQLALPGKTLPLGPGVLVFETRPMEGPYSNTMVFRLLGEGDVLFEREYHSVGGGFIQWKGQPEPEPRAPAYPYETMAQVREHLAETGLSLPQLALRNEKSLTGASEAQIQAGLDRILAAMEASVNRGLEAEGRLPGGLGLKRKAPSLIRWAKIIPAGADRFLVNLNAYAFAASEENAAGRIVVTAPTSGSAGVIPAVLTAMRRHLKLPRQALRDGLLAAAVIGFLAKHNASIAGADVGCQGEVGVASAMAAALLACGRGHSTAVVENAAETALEHHLGLTCDPVGGLVQIPCIERNAMGAVKAYNACLIAASMDPGLHLVNLDKAIRAMAETGRDLSCKYKETATGGLAISVPEC